MSVYNANGSLRHAPDAVNNNPASNTDYSSIAGLAGGGFVVAWEEWTGVGGDTEVRFRRFDANGYPSTGAIRRRVDRRDRQRQPRHPGRRLAGRRLRRRLCGQRVGQRHRHHGARLQCGRNSAQRAHLCQLGGEWRHCERRSGASHADRVARRNISSSAGSTGKSNCSRLTTPPGNPLGLNSTIKGNVVDGEIAALNSGVIAHVWRSSITDGSGDAIHTALQEFARLITGDGSSETIDGINDGIWEVLRGLGGDDILEGKAGRDTLEGGAGGDSASYRQAPAGLTASLINPEVNTGDAAGDTYTSIENLAGSDFDDVLVGNAGRNILRGHDGDDRLIGGLEDDSIAGGSGRRYGGLRLHVRPVSADRDRR